MILLTYGTRPEYIKIKPLISAFIEHDIPFKILSTGQHEHIADGIYDFKLSMDNNGTNRLDTIIQNCMNLPDEYFEGIEYVLVQGDTTSVTGLSLAALHRKIKVIHLEAGLRTFDNENPFPEENNRRIVSTIADIHLCPTELNAFNLRAERAQGEIYVVGNTVLDNLLEYKDSCEYTDTVLITLHRRENHEDIGFWFWVINDLAECYPHIKFILPLHPNPMVQKHKNILTHVEVIDPLSHDELLKILVKTKMVITDSGGLQEECSFFNKKCLVCRQHTERPESLGLTSFLIDEPDNLFNIFFEHIDKYVVDFESPYGDGKSADRIAMLLKGIITQ